MRFTEFDKKIDNGIQYSDPRVSKTIEILIPIWLPVIKS